jgi:hypothetical protein
VLCHVIRQLVEVSQRSGATSRRGKTLVTLARAVIAAHREFLTDGHDADWLTAQLQPLRAQIRVPLEQYAAGRHTRTANFAAGLLDEYRVADGALCRVVGRVDAEIGDVAERPQWAATPFVTNKCSCVFTYRSGRTAVRGRRGTRGMLLASACPARHHWPMDRASIIYSRRSAARVTLRIVFATSAGSSYIGT